MITFYNVKKEYNLHSTSKNCFHSKKFMIEEKWFCIVVWNFLQIFSQNWPVEVSQSSTFVHFLKVSSLAFCPEITVSYENKNWSCEFYVSDQHKHTHTHTHEENISWLALCKLKQCSYMTTRDMRHEMLKKFPIVVSCCRLFYFFFPLLYLIILCIPCVLVLACITWY